MRSAAGSNLDRTDPAREVTRATPTFHERAAINQIVPRFESLSIGVPIYLIRTLRHRS